MSKIKLVKRIKYAGDVHAALMELGWDAETAAAFLDDIPDAAAVEVVRCKDCKHGEIDDPDFPYQYYCHMGHMWNDAFHFCADGERRADHAD